MYGVANTLQHLPLSLNKPPALDTSSLYQLYRQYPSVRTDTRQLKPGDMYFALKGANFNGNQFALQALEKGAAYAIVDEPMAMPHPQIILVADVLSTLQALALYHRKQLGIPVIAITGSNGKTTTKELVHAVLSSHFRTYTTKGNLNNHIGVPLTLLSIQPDAEIAVVEMGANHRKKSTAIAAILHLHMASSPIAAKHIWRALVELKAYVKARVNCMIFCVATMALFFCLMIMITCNR
jgi:UDP-N-acetylmuramyl pentapeptide synthase